MSQLDTFGNVTTQDIWIKHFLKKLGILVHHPTVIYCNNQRTLKFCKISMTHIMQFPQVISMILHNFQDFQLYFEQNEL